MSKLNHKELSEQKIAELTADIQRVQADFVNYRNRVEEEKQRLAASAKAVTVMKLLPVIDNIELAINHVPADLAGNNWAQGIVGLGKNLEKSLSELGLSKITAEPGTLFDPQVHEAVMMEDGEGDQEVVSLKMREGYLLDKEVVRPAMVKVTHVIAKVEEPVADAPLDVPDNL